MTIPPVDYAVFRLSIQQTDKTKFLSKVTRFENDRSIILIELNFASREEAFDESHFDYFDVSEIDHFTGNIKGAASFSVRSYQLKWSLYNTAVVEVTGLRQTNYEGSSLTWMG